MACEKWVWSRTANDWTHSDRDHQFPTLARGLIEHLGWHTRLLFPHYMHTYTHTISSSLQVLIRVFAIDDFQLATARDLLFCYFSFSVVCCVCLSFFKFFCSASLSVICVLCVLLFLLFSFFLLSSFRKEEKEFWWQAQSEVAKATRSCRLQMWAICLMGGKKRRWDENIPLT